MLANQPKTRTPGRQRREVTGKHLRAADPAFEVSVRRLFRRGGREPPFDGVWQDGSEEIARPQKAVQTEARDSSVAREADQRVPAPLVQRGGQQPQVVQPDQPILILMMRETVH